MGHTVRKLLFCLSWLFCVCSVSATSLMSDLTLSEEDGTDLDEEQTIQDFSETSNSAYLSQIGNSFDQLTHIKRTTGNMTAPAVLKEIIAAYNYLKKYNYISQLPRGNQDVRTALETFQRFMHLPVTGMLDNTTISVMKKRRCGVPDVQINDNSLGRRRKRFAVSKRKWDKTTLLYAFETYTADMSVQAQKAVIAKAFKLWSDVSPLVFTITTDLSKADITIMFGTFFHGKCSTPFDGQGKVLAHAFYPKSGQLHFDDDELFTDGTSAGTNLLSVAVHEIGHSLGLAHSTDVKSIMFPIAHKYIPSLTLSTDDKNAIRYLYAGGTSSPGSPVCKDIWLSCASITTYCNMFPDIMISRCKKTCKFCV